MKKINLFRADLVVDILSERLLPPLCRAECPGKAPGSVRPFSQLYLVRPGHARPGQATPEQAALQWLLGPPETQSDRELSAGKVRSPPHYIAPSQ